MNYAELLESATRRAGALRELEVVRDDRIAMLQANCIADLPLPVLFVIVAGGTRVPLALGSLRTTSVTYFNAVMITSQHVACTVSALGKKVIRSIWKRLV